MKATAEYQAYKEHTENPLSKVSYKKTLVKELQNILDDEVVPLMR